MARTHSGAILGNGWYCGGWQHWQSKLKAIYGTEPLLRAQLDIEFADGSRQTVVSDASWRGTTDGPLQFAGIYKGASYDARKEMPGWDSPPFDDVKWSAVTAPQAGDDFKVGQLVWQRGNPIRATQELKPLVDHRAQARRLCLRVCSEHGRLLPLHVAWKGRR